MFQIGYFAFHFGYRYVTDLINKSDSQSLSKLIKTQLLESNLTRDDNYVVNNAYDYLYRPKVI